MNKLTLITLAIFALQGQGAFAAEQQSKNSYNSFKEKQAKQISQQKKKYNAFKKNYLDRYEKYREEIKAKWGVAELSSKTEFINYDSENKTKVVADFENDVIEVNIQDAENLSPAELAKRVKSAVARSLNISPNEEVKQNIEFDVVKKPKPAPRQSRPSPKSNKKPLLEPMVAKTSSANKTSTNTSTKSPAKKSDAAKIASQPLQVKERADTIEVTKKAKETNLHVSSDSLLTHFGIATQAKLEKVLATATEVRPEQQVKDVVKRTKQRLTKQIMNLENYSSQENVKPKAIKQSKALIASMHKEKKAVEKDAASLTKKNIKTYRISLKRDRYKKAEQFLSQVGKSADKWKIEKPMILAVMETESHFNPLAKSFIPAYGLMQIVPSTAGRDVNNRIYEVREKPTPATLFQSEENIKYGSAYIHILMTRYLKEITNPTSRLYCAIAAYNTGIGNLAKAFNNGEKGRLKAMKKINTLTPDEVYKIIKKRTHTETQRYLDKVLDSKSYFEKHEA